MFEVPQNSTKTNPLCPERQQKTFGQDDHFWSSVFEKKKFWRDKNDTSSSFGAKKEGTFYMRGKKSVYERKFSLLFILYSIPILFLFYSYSKQHNTP